MTVLVALTTISWTTAAQILPTRPIVCQAALDHGLGPYDKSTVVSSGAVCSPEEMMRRLAEGTGYAPEALAILMATGGCVTAPSALAPSLGGDIDGDDPGFEDRTEQARERRRIFVPTPRTGPMANDARAVFNVMPEHVLEITYAGTPAFANARRLDYTSGVLNQIGDPNVRVVLLNGWAEFSSASSVAQILPFMKLAMANIAPGGRLVLITRTHGDRVQYAKQARAAETLGLTTKPIQFDDYAGLEIRKD